ncbi:MAG: molybdate ABC transporter substrate-binding protein [Xanthobacteraceae bacterium]|jgi:molybdate transport system substrate-binding protein
MFVRVLAVVLLAIAAVHPALAQDKTVTVFVAASMTNVANDLNGIFTRNTGIKVTPSYAASSALAKQIEQGAPADVFISADIPWMDYVQERKLTRNNTRFDIAGNRLVLIAPKDSKIGEQKIGSGFDLAKLAGDGRIATGDVKSVPVGRYAQASLQKLGSWAAAESKFAMTDNVRAALVLVSRGEAALGIVYETDAAVERGVKIVGRFPPDSHPPIVYPVALTEKAKPEADAYFKLLRSATAQVILEKYGFTYLPKAGP